MLSSGHVHGFPPGLGQSGETGIGNLDGANWFICAGEGDLRDGLLRVRVVGQCVVGSAVKMAGQCLLELLGHGGQAGFYSVGGNGGPPGAVQAPLSGHGSHNGRWLAWGVENVVDGDPLGLLGTEVVRVRQVLRGGVLPSEGRRGFTVLTDAEDEEVGDDLGVGER